MKTISRHTATLGPLANSLVRSACRQIVGGIAAFERRVAYRRLTDASRLRIWAGKASAGKPPKTLVARLVDGPLSGSTRDVTAVEGRPPKTIDIDCGDRRVRYCLAEWEQSGHSAIYGFLYDV